MSTLHTDKEENVMLVYIVYVQNYPTVSLLCSMRNWPIAITCSYIIDSHLVVHTTECKSNQEIVVTMMSEFVSQCFMIVMIKDW